MGWRKNFFSADNANYIVNWIMRQPAHVDYVGCWNERQCNPNWVVSLHQLLVANNLDTKIIYADYVHDPNWVSASEINDNDALKNAVSVVGAHYPQWQSTSEAQALPQALWASEDGPWDGTWGGASTLARLYNRNYLLGKMTATLIWSPVTSYYDNLPLPGSGLMYANTPWSAAYTIQPAISATAHTTRFIKPGWRYLDSSSGLLPQGGSYVSATDPNTANLSIVIETFGASRSQSLVVSCNALSARLSQAHLWMTSETASLVDLGNVNVVGGALTLNLEPDKIYSFSTLGSAASAWPVPTTPGNFPASYKDDFEEIRSTVVPRFLADITGSFAVGNCNSRGGNCLNQIVASAPIQWNSDGPPLTLLAPRQWTDHSVEVDVLPGGPSGLAGLFGHFQSLSSLVQLDISAGGMWQLSQNGNLTASGSAGGTSAWHTIGLDFSDDRITAFLDHNILVTRQSPSSPGFVGLLSDYSASQFDNFQTHDLRVIDDANASSLASVAYSSGWTAITGDPVAHEGTIHYAFNANEVAVVTFHGTGLTIYGDVGPDFGVAAISLDGASANNYDFYAPVRASRPIYVAKNLTANGNHVVTVKATGTTVSGTSTYISLDSIDVLDPLTFDDGPQTNRYLSTTYQGSWQFLSDNQAFDGTVRYSQNANDYIDIAFNGTGLTLYAITDPTCGVAGISVDGNAEVGVNTYSLVRNSHRIWTSPTLAAGLHRVRVRVTGEAAAPAVASYIAIDRMDVENTLSVVVDDADPTVDYFGAWGHVRNEALANNYTQSYSLEPNDYVLVPFQGSNVTMYGIMDTNEGLGAVSIDGASEAIVDFYAPSRTRAVIWQSAILSPGSHLLRLRVLGTHGSSSSNNYVSFDDVVSVDE